jgi:superfamily I DNA and/or RNA helicase
MTYDIMCMSRRGATGASFNGRVGIISPYRQQVLHIQRLLHSYGRDFDGVEVDTVDGFQGSINNDIVPSVLGLH